MAFNPNFTNIGFGLGLTERIKPARTKISEKARQLRTNFGLTLRKKHLIGHYDFTRGFDTTSHFGDLSAKLGFQIVDKLLPRSFFFDEPIPYPRGLGAQVSNHFFQFFVACLALGV